MDGLPVKQRYLCSSGTPTLLGTRHRLCIISRPVARPSPGNGAAAVAPRLWQRQWVVIEFGKVRGRPGAMLLAWSALCDRDSHAAQRLET